MKQRQEHQKQEEQVLVININLTRGLVALLALALLVAALLGTLAWGEGEAAASSPQAPLASSASLRRYYRTEAPASPPTAPTACAEGYHFASLWEILDPSNLKYDTDLGVTRADSGQGPPSYLGGWVRTGSISSTSSTPGTGNCNAWASSDSGHQGTYAYLPRDWGAGQDIHVWEVETPQCHLGGYVWCVEDYIATIYLPLLLRD